MNERTVFFIAGLPRSRTAWLANFLTWGEMFCYHDLWSGGSKEQHFLSEMTSNPARAVGNSDPANALHHVYLTQEFPEAKWIIVNRPIADVHVSCQRVGLADMSVLENLARKMKKSRGRVNALEIEFDEVDANGALELGRIILPGWDCPIPRMNLLDQLNVQTHAPAALAKIATMRPEDLVAAEPLGLSEANQRYLAAVRRLCDGQPQAFAWFLCVLELATVWDHCIDGDGVSPAMADRVFTAVTTEWPCNEWWLTHRAALVPALVAARSAWRWSNRADAPKFKAYDLYTELPAVMAWLIGGNALVETALPSIRECALALLEEDERRDGGKK